MIPGATVTFHDRFPKLHLMPCQFIDTLLIAFIMHKILGLFLGAVGSVVALTPLDTFYPPNLNQTAWISNHSAGTYGGTYKAPTKGPTEGNPYGVYDYCSMPHPRAQEYKLPQPIANGSTQGKLVYLEYLQRHQRRAPYNILPGGEVSRGF